MFESGRALLSFIGSIPPPLRSIVHEYTRSWEVDDIHVACSGNFTIERALEGRCRLHSNDVSIYTSMVGAWLADRDDLPLAVKAEHQDEWGWLSAYLTTPIDRAATVMIGTSAFQGLHRATPFHQRQRAAYRDQWPRLHADTLDKLAAVDLRLASYSPCDASAFLHTVPPDGAVLSFPPFYSGGYETLYAGLDELFEWDAPTYDVMDLDGLHAMIEQLESRPHWLYGLDHRHPDREDHLRGVVQVSNRNVPIYVYSSHGSTRWTGPAQTMEAVTAPKLGVDDELGDRLALAKLSAGQVNALRSHYLDPRIAPAATELALGVLVDGVLVGCFALSRDKFANGANAYLLSDFPVAPTQYKRLSKLILYAALSREAQVMIERTLSRRVRVILTTAFSDHPSSGKYRGLFKLTKRTETPDAPHAFQLNYAADAGAWTLAEGLATWKEKHGQA